MIRTAVCRFIQVSSCVASALLALTICADASGSCERGWTAWSQPAASDGGVRSGFRLGNAAAPFGWSTAIGDFNTDGKLDVAVADHIPAHTSGYAYRLEFAIAGRAAHGVTFESNLEAIAIRLADVDRDNDLDVVIGAPISGETVGIWLNDGQGNFEAGDVAAAPQTIAPLETLQQSNRSADFSAADASARIHGALPSTAGVMETLSGYRSARRDPDGPRSAFFSSQTHPRAPPLRGLLS